VREDAPNTWRIDIVEEARVGARPATHIQDASHAAEIIVRKHRGQLFVGERCLT